MSVTSVASTITSTQLSDGNRNAVGVYNTDANALYVLCGGTGDASSTNFTAKLNADDYWETPPGYGGAKIVGVWAGDGSGAALVTEF